MSVISIDNMEYSSASNAQTAYATNASETVDQENTSVNDQDIFGNYSGTQRTGFAQSFILSGAVAISAVEVKRGATTSGTPSGNWTIRIETDNAGKPSGTLVDTNASVVVTPPAAGEIVKGTFPFIIPASASTVYHAVILCDNQGTDVYWKFADSYLNPYANGKISLRDNGTWSNYNGGDMYFKIYTRSLQSYSEPIIKTQDNYALKIIAGADSLNKTLTKNFGAYDVYDSYTKLCSHFDGADAAIAYTDPIAGAATFVGTAQLDTAQYKFGTASLLLDGNSDYITYPDSDNYYFGTGNFTIDFWIRFNTIGVNQVIVGQYENNTAYWIVKLDSDNKLQLVFRHDSTFLGYYIQTSAWAGLATNTWYHIACVRNGTCGLIFVDGVSQTLTEVSAFSTNDVGNLASDLFIGQLNGAQFVDGWIDEVRISKGVARWTSNFIPPDYLNFTNLNTINFDIRSTRTGQNIKIGLHNEHDYISNADIDDEDMADITDWTDNDFGTGVSSQATFDSKSCMKLDTGANTVSGSGRTQDVGGYSARTVFSMKLYCDAIGTLEAGDSLQFAANEGTHLLNIHFASNGLFVYDTIDGSAHKEIGTDLVVQDVWQEWTFDVNWVTTTMDVYLNKMLVATSVSCHYNQGDPNGTTYFELYDDSTANRIVYIDWFKAGSEFVSVETTTEVTPNIISANLYQKVQRDISSVNNANKNNIDKMIFTVVDSDTPNTIYFDNIYALNQHKRIILI